MSEENLKLYNAASHPPAWALRPIAGGPLKGKTDIKPAWRMRAITEIYGLCGFGWKYEIVKIWTEDSPDGQRMIYAQINMFVKYDEKWSDPIPGIGGSMSVEKGNNALRANDEGVKMAITDALSVCMRAIGIASAIYEGAWSGSKYLDEPKEQPMDSDPSPEEAAMIRRAEELEAECDSFETKEQFSSRKKQLEEEFRGHTPVCLLNAMSISFARKFPKEKK